MRRISAIVVACMALLVPVNTARAQESVGVTEILRVQREFSSRWLSLLRVMYQRGDSAKLVETAALFLDDAGSRVTLPGGGVCCNYRRNHILVLFVATDAQGKATLVHVLVHDPPVENGALPGLEGPDDPLLEIFLAEDDTVRIQGFYDVERVEDPTVRQTTDFVTTVISKAVFPVALGNLPEVANNVAILGGGAGNTTTAYWLTLSAVELPYKRAKLVGHHTIAVTDPVEHMTWTVAAIAGEFRLSQARVALDRAMAPTINLRAAVPQLVCNDLTAATAMRLTDTLSSDVCRNSIVDLTDCLKQLKSDLTAAFVEGSQACSAEDARKAVSAFVPVLTPATTVVGTVSLTNAPLQRYSFGLASGYLTGIAFDASKPRAQISGNKIQPNPFNRSLTMAVINLPVWGYNSSTFEPSVRERLPRPFIGFPFTPYFGVSTGASLLLKRPLALNFGWAWLWYDTPKTSETVGEAPVNVAEPFGLAHAGAWFLGVGYNFTK